jgi:hypothetical protein
MTNDLVCVVFEEGTQFVGVVQGVSDDHGVLVCWYYADVLVVLEFSQGCSLSLVEVGLERMTWLNSKVEIMLFKHCSELNKFLSFVQDYPLEEVLSGCYLISSWRPDLIEMVLGYLTPENIR